MPIYAQLNAEGVCTGISELAAAVSDPLLIRLDAFDHSAMGKYWDGSAFVAPPVQPETPEQAADRLEHAVDAHLDAVARSRGYDGIQNACGYAAAPNPFQAESQAFVTLRGNVWATCYQIMSDVQAGARPIPTAEELIAELPALAPKA